MITQKTSLVDVLQYSWIKIISLKEYFLHLRENSKSLNTCRFYIDLNQDETTKFH